MKRVILTLLGLAVISNLAMPAQAGFISDIRAKIKQIRIEKNYYKEIENVFKKQDEYVAKYDVEGLKTLYGDNFINNDGYNKEVYFSLVKETWETYPDITYTTHIKDIKVIKDTEKERLDQEEIEHQKELEELEKLEKEDEGMREE